MAQPQQQQYQMAQQPRSFSPPQASPPPAAQQQFQPNKRQRVSPPPSQGPYVPSHYASSGMSSNTPAMNPANTSPLFSNLQLPQYTTPYTNGGQPTPPLSHSQPHSQPNTYNMTPLQSPLGFPGQHQVNNHNNHNNYSMPVPQSAGAMGPPSKPVEKPNEDGVDVMDVLGGTGIDLREEELYSFQMYNTSFNSQQSGSQSGTISSGHSFTQFPPGDEASFYGAGPANAAAEEAKTKSQEELYRKTAETSWRTAAHNLATSRQRELDNPFLVVKNVHMKMEKIAREHGIMLNVDINKQMGTMKRPDDFPSPTVRVQGAVGPSGLLTTTSGTFIPHDSLLVDQLALMSIATKYRLRGLLEDAAKLAKGRQTSSHGGIPGEWADIAAPLNDSAIIMTEGAPRSGWESAVSPHSNPLKRSLSVANRIPTPVSEGTKTPLDPVKLPNALVIALRKTAVLERELEDARGAKRKARNSGEAASRQGSVMPGTPGSVAPESVEKAPSKKELKKKAEVKTIEAASHAAANNTTAQFLGAGGGLFGKKKKYAWLQGNPGSGASTPGRITTQGLPGNAASPVVSAAPERFTSEGVRRLGQWREDKEKGRGVQIRDWITVLEDDGRERKALQKAYVSLDQSEPK